MHRRALWGNLNLALGLDEILALCLAPLDLASLRGVKAVSHGWWYGDYALGVLPWSGELGTRGAASNLTSREFSDEYADRFERALVTWLD